MEVEFGAVGQTSRFVELDDVNYNTHDTITFKFLAHPTKYEVRDFIYDFFGLDVRWLLLDSYQRQVHLVPH